MGAVEPAADGSDRGVDTLSDFVVGQSFDVGHPDEFALLGGERGEGLFEFFAEEFAEHRLERVRAVVSGLEVDSVMGTVGSEGGVVAHGLDSAGSGAAEIEEETGDDSEDPVFKGSVAFKAAERFHRPDKRFLCEVFGITSVLAEAIGEIKHFAVAPIHQILEALALKASEFD